ncbi:MAG: hypothetical protein K8R77_16355 [Anaerolineaceae bacterium]|nr:hypothetical protein [Anaerolineaceae bacterium]
MMNIWFVRANGETAHNNSNDVAYVPGEPPVFPLREFNYTQKCLDDGFVRYGWPNTGDRTAKNPIRLAPQSYSFDDLKKRYQTYLNKFCSIKAGDFILLPANGQNRGDVHLGIALTANRKKALPYIEPRPNAYFYYHDVQKGDWYECAHRVNVLWGCTKDEEFSIFHINAAEQIKVWNLAFSLVKDNEGVIYQMAKKAGLF